METVREALQAGWTQEGGQHLPDLSANIRPPAQMSMLARAIGESGTTEELPGVTAPRGPQTPLPSTAWNHHVNDGWLPCALLNICGGSGVCRMAVQDQFQHHTRRLILVASAFAEIDAAFSQAVADFWSRGGGPLQADGPP